MLLGWWVVVLRSIEGGPTTRRQRWWAHPPICCDSCNLHGCLHGEATWEVRWGLPYSHVHTHTHSLFDIHIYIYIYIYLFIWHVYLCRCRTHKVIEPFINFYKFVHVPVHVRELRRTLFFTLETVCGYGPCPKKLPHFLKITKMIWEATSILSQWANNNTMSYRGSAHTLRV